MSGRGASDSSITSSRSSTSYMIAFLLTATAVLCRPDRKHGRRRWNVVLSSQFADLPLFLLGAGSAAPLDVGLALVRIVLEESPFDCDTRGILPNYALGFNT